MALMLRDFLFYLLGIVATLGGALLLERIVAGPHSTAGTGYARVDSAFDFDRMRRRQYGPGMPGVLRRGRPETLPLLQAVTREPWQLREAGEQLIPVASIVGSVDGASQLFDPNFRPVSDRARARLSSVLVAMRQGEPFPPIEVRAWHGEYYVFDGHHRVAAARALGSDYINAHVIEVVELSHHGAKAVKV
jgi:hypothetical protein